jgi:3-deoxy-manno-octulosonate cytidylyltransferase (CMP-KDO synthetase)
MQSANTIVVIPARMASMRLPGKPLAMIAGLPMIVQVARRAIEAGVGRVVVAAAEAEIVAVVAAHGLEGIVTDPGLPSGSDRVAACLAAIDPERRYGVVLNLQGDLPTIAPVAVRACLCGLDLPGADIATVAALITEPSEVANPNVVKALAPLAGHDGPVVARDFVRLVPADARPPHWHHIGIYAYRREVLERFVSLAPSVREIERRLEQMRALDAGMTIAITRVDTVPLGVDTPADLERARLLIASPDE